MDRELIVKRVGTVPEGAAAKPAAESGEEIKLLPRISKALRLGIALLLFSPDSGIRENSPQKTNVNSLGTIVHSPSQRGSRDAVRMLDIFPDDDTQVQDQGGAEDRPSQNLLDEKRRLLEELERWQQRVKEVPIA